MSTSTTVDLRRPAAARPTIGIEGAVKEREKVLESKKMGAKNAEKDEDKTKEITVSITGDKPEV
jgi:hypothetical protein